MDTKEGVGVEVGGGVHPPCQENGSGDPRQDQANTEDRPQALTFRASLANIIFSSPCDLQGI